jgi:TalC/MipB family fructose-6-phosphate aldolase
MRSSIREGIAMELILDTADLDAIRELDGMLEVSGVTTNPKIIAKSGKEPEEVIGELVDYLRPDQKLFVQTVQTDFDGIMEEARYISGLRPENIFVKIPVTHDGLRAVKAAKAEGIGVLATAILNAEVAFMAAMDGADYLAPYVNRMSNYGDGVGQVLDLIDMLAVQGLPTKVCAASFKNVDQVHRLILGGIQAVTIPPDVVFAMIDHPGIQAAVDDFSAVWHDAFGRDTFR